MINPAWKVIIGLIYLCWIVQLLMTQIGETSIVLVSLHNLDLDIACEGDSEVCGGFFQRRNFMATENVLERRNEQ